MGQPFVVTLERNIGVECDIEPQLLLGSFGGNELATIAWEQDLTPLRAFLSSNEKDQLKFAELYPFDGEYEIDPEIWFEADEALKTICGLLTYLQSDAQVPNIPNSGIPTVEYFKKPIIEALEVTQSVLEEAQKHNVRFHFTALI